MSLIAVTKQGIAETCLNHLQAGLEPFEGDDLLRTYAQVPMTQSMQLPAIQLGNLRSALDRPAAAQDIMRCRDLAESGNWRSAHQSIDQPLIQRGCNSVRPLINTDVVDQRLAPRVSDDRP